MKLISKIIMILSLLNAHVYAQEKIEIQDVKTPLFISVNEDGLFITEIK